MPPTRQLPPPDPALRQRGIAALSLAALSLIGLALGLGNLHRGIYVAVLTLIFALIAIWLGATAVRQARRGGTARPRGAVSGIVLGCFGLAVSAIWLLALAVFWPQLNAYFNCLASANTVTAQQVCHSQFTNSVSGEIGLLQNGK
jgi:peptidoglycan/LPS O-acetylase OafA/YrhL